MDFFDKPDFFNQAMGVAMSASLGTSEWKPKESFGYHGEPLVIEADGMELQRLPFLVVARRSFTGCLTEAARHSGMDDHELADELCISPGYFSRFMRAVGEQWAKRLVDFMRLTRSIAPLQWLADQMGCDVVPRFTTEPNNRACMAHLMDARSSSHGYFTSCHANA